MTKTITIEQDEYDEMKELMERMRETIDILSNNETTKKLSAAVERMNKGDCLTEEQLES